MNRLRHFVLGACAALLAACAAPLQLPDGFVELEDPGSGYRAVTSDDARLWVREFADPTEGSLEFWAESLQRDFVDERGYELVASGEIANRDGARGRWLEATTNVRGERVDYLVALWVREHELLVVQFAARSDTYHKRVASVRSALATVHW